MDFEDGAAIILYVCNEEGHKIDEGVLYHVTQARGVILICRISPITVFHFFQENSIHRLDPPLWIDIEQGGPYSKTVIRVEGPACHTMFSTQK